MIAIKVEDFGKLGTNAKPEVLALLADAPQQLAAAGILDNPLRMCHFMAQVMNESGHLRSVQESLNYSAERLKVVWPNHFSDEAVANQYAHNEEKLANFIYGQGSIATKLGNTQPGDGYKFRGRGLLQITGRDNYTRMGQLIGIPLADDPDQAIKPETALKVAVGVWTHSRYNNKSCNEMADADDVVGVTHAVNGGEIGIDDRKQWLAKAKLIWTAAAVAEAGAAAATAAANSAPTTAPSAPPAANPQPQAAPAQPKPPPAAPKPSPQPVPDQRGGATFSAFIAFLAGAVAFLDALFEPIRLWLHAQRLALQARIGFDPLWIVAAIFVLAILFVIFVRMEHRARLRKAAA